jgi:hypothetical protein
MIRRSSSSAKQRNLYSQALRDESVRKLNELDAEGWEAVGSEMATGDYTCFVLLKRRAG